MTATQIERNMWNVAYLILRDQPKLDHDLAVRFPDNALRLTMKQVAHSYAREYTGDFSLVRDDFKARVLIGQVLSDRQCEVVLNTLVGDANRVMAAKNAAKTDPTTKAPVRLNFTAERVAPNAIYTVVQEGGEYVTIRLTDDWRPDAPKHSQVAQYLAGPENTSDYIGFAFVLGDSIKVWKKYQANENSKIQAALRFIIEGGEEAQKQGAFQYARMSGNCAICGRTLTTPESIERGIGPVCAEKVGW
jgi:hypothetical protein